MDNVRTTLALNAILKRATCTGKKAFDSLRTQTLKDESFCKELSARIQTMKHHSRKQPQHSTSLVPAHKGAVLISPLPAKCVKDPGKWEIKLCHLSLIALDDRFIDFRPTIILRVKKAFYGSRRPPIKPSQSLTLDPILLLSRGRLRLLPIFSGLTDEEQAGLPGINTSNHTQSIYVTSPNTSRLSADIKQARLDRHFSSSSHEITHDSSPNGERYELRVPPTSRNTSLSYVEGQPKPGLVSDPSFSKATSASFVSGTEQFTKVKSLMSHSSKIYIRIKNRKSLLVHNACKYAKEWTTSGKGPLLLEFITYRYGGHSMSDPGTTYRSREEIQHMRSTNDPITGLRNRLLEWNVIKEADLKAIDKQAKAEVDVAVEEAEKSPEPDSATDMWTDIYYKGTAPKWMRGREKEEVHRYKPEECKAIKQGSSTGTASKAQRCGRAVVVSRDASPVPSSFQADLRQFSYVSFPETTGSVPSRSQKAQPPPGTDHSLGFLPTPQPAKSLLGRFKSAIGASAWISPATASEHKTFTIAFPTCPSLPPVTMNYSQADLDLSNSFDSRKTRGQKISLNQSSRSFGTSSSSPIQAQLLESHQYSIPQASVGIPHSSSFGYSESPTRPSSSMSFRAINRSVDGILDTHRPPAHASDSSRAPFHFNSLPEPENNFPLISSDTLLRSLVLDNGGGNHSADFSAVPPFSHIPDFPLARETVGDDSGSVFSSSGGPSTTPKKAKEKPDSSHSFSRETSSRIQGIGNSEGKVILRRSEAFLNSVRSRVFGFNYKVVAIANQEAS
ncbi:hypothetical protein PtB15_11B221 [Puccinia triticina]|nr:hypothetical protein PtB15_11B221 [Puccinia triticina]